MANKTVKLNPNSFIDEMKTINAKAQNAAIDLLGKQGDNRYIVVMDWEDSFTEYYNNAFISISVHGVGLNDDNNLCIAATVNYQGYGCSDDDFEKDWVETSKLDIPNYAHLYRFVADNIDKAMTKEEADRLAKKYWYGNGHDCGKYDRQDDFINGFARVMLDDKTGFVNEKGEEIIPCKYEDAFEFSEGLAAVLSEESWGFIDKTGEEIIPCKYESAFDFSEGLAIVRSEGGWGFINKKGEEIVPCKYKDAYRSKDGLTRVLSKKGWGYINEKGKVIIPCKYEDADKFRDGLARVKTKEGWGFINIDGEEIIPCKYEDATIFCDGLAMVQQNGEWITINKTGKQVAE